ncbi:MAG: HlyD family efflux transporter periplasmic adaptor subunit [Chloroflexi bacterium]|nr:HlyD family efflux transporter periplasmic adaptor subunit [Chloroflexota bacterium]
MKRTFIGFVTVGLLMASGCAATNAEPTQTAAPAQVVKADDTVVAEARVVPARSAALSAATGGAVVEVLVRLDSKRQAAAAAQAEANLARAKAQLDQLKAGPRQQEVETAQAGLDAAQAQLAKLEQGARPEDVSAAAAAVAAAQADLQSAKDGASDEQLAAVQADLANAEAVLKLRQADYDRVAYEPGIAARPESIALEQATNTYLAAKARYDELAKGPTQAALDAANARVRQAAAQLNGLKAPPRQADLDAVKAEVRRAQAQLDLVKAGARTEVVAAAEADTAAAQATLDQARVALSDTELQAPFAGVIAALNAKIGEQVALGAPVVQLADTSEWQIETTDLTELSIVNVREGAAATVTFDALPGFELSGKVLRVKPLGENKQGDIVYTVVVKPDTQDERLRWNMTAAVAIAPAN